MANDTTRLDTQFTRDQEILQPVIDEHHLGLLDGSVRTPGSHSNTHISGHQTRRIIHSIADHRHSMTLPLEFPDGRDLVLGLERRSHLVDACGCSHFLSRRQPIAGKHHCAKPGRAKLCHDGFGIGPQGVLEHHTG